MRSAAIFLLVLITPIIAERLYYGEKYKQLESFSEGCTEETQVDLQKLSQMRQGNLIEDDGIKEYLLCILKKLRWMTECGHLNKDYIKGDVANNISAKEAMSHCMDIDEQSGKNTAYKMFKCYIKYLPLDFKATL